MRTVVIAGASLCAALAGTPAVAVSDRPTIGQVTARAHRLDVLLHLPTDWRGPLGPHQIEASLGECRPIPVRVDAAPGSPEPAAYIFVVDTSQSLTRPALARITEGITMWLEGLRPQDRAALLTFDDDVRVVVPLTSDGVALMSALVGLRPRGRYSVLRDAVWDALQLAADDGDPFAVRRALIVLSDGQDEMSGRSLTNLERALRETHVPIYAFAYETRGVPAAQAGATFLRSLAIDSGGAFAEMTGGAVDAHKAAVARARSARRVVFDLHACAPGQVVAPLRLRVGGVPAPPVHVDLRVPQAPPAPPRRDSKPAWSWPTGGAIAAIAAALWWRQRSRRHQAATNARATEPRAASAVSTPAQPGPVLRLRLTVVTGVRRGRSCDIDASVTSLGRKAGASDLLADDPAVLPRHCDIAIEPGRCRLVSTPGASLLINGAPSPGGGIVRDGDTATLGHTELRLRTVADRTVPLAALDGLHTEAPPRAAR